jgi:hypothetical protein
MLLFRRPGQPKGFAKHVAPARRAVKLAIAAGQRAGQIVPIWRDEEYRSAFIAAQHDKCGYCETKVSNHGKRRNALPPRGH